MVAAAFRSHVFACKDALCGVLNSYQCTSRNRLSGQVKSATNCVWMGVCPTTGERFRKSLISI